MTGIKVIPVKKNMIGLALVLMLALAVMCGCADRSGASEKVSKELDSLKSSDFTGSELTELRNSLSDEGKEDFDSFAAKLRDFDYEISDVSKSDDSEDESTLVTVKIKTYDFGKEYLSEWTDYLKEHKEGPDADETAFYEDLFERLSELDDKDYIRKVGIVCIEPIDNGEWIANVKENEELQDAIFGGMLGEMKDLAGE